MTSSEYLDVLNNIADAFGTLKDQVNRAFEVGRKYGLSDMQIGTDIRRHLKGQVTDNTIQRMLPETAKHMQHASKHKTEPIKLIGSSKNQTRLVTDQEPQIPPSPQVIREVQLSPELLKPEPEVNNEVFLSCRKFSTELRMGLLNNSVLKLELNSNNEVIKIT
jgi:hypothetical protein